MISFSYSYNNNIASLLGVPPIVDVKDIQCSWNDHRMPSGNNLELCLKADRKTKPKAIYLLGDSHSTQFFSMLEELSKKSDYQVKHINTTRDFPYSFLNEEFSSREFFDFLLADIQHHDVVIFTFLKGKLNDNYVYYHLPLDQEVNANDKTINMEKHLSRIVGELLEKGVNVIFIKDTPLMGSVSTSQTCYLQIKLTGKSVCEVSKKQDLHTRTRQDYVYDTIKSKYKENKGKN